MRPARHANHLNPQFQRYMRMHESGLASYKDIARAMRTTITDVRHARRRWLDWRKEQLNGLPEKENT